MEDVAALIKAVLDDPDLPVDKSKVALAGYSAGGTLVLTALQTNGIHRRIKGTVAYYPATDIMRTPQIRRQTATPPPTREDIVISMSPSFNWAYIPNGQDLRDPLISPIQADLKMLPKKLLILGCEYDLLFTEAKDAAEKFAAQQEHNPKTALGAGRTG